MNEIYSDDWAKSLIGKSPYEIYKAIRDLDKEKGKGASMDTLQKSKEFGEYCTQQLHAFLDNRLALTQRDADNVEIWWKYSNHDFALEDIKRADAKVAKGLFVRSERFFNMNTNPTFLKFVQHIPDIQEEMALPSSEKTDLQRRNQRQKIIDFFRFVISSKKTIDLINDGKWELLQKEFAHFPQMPIQLITKLYDKIFEYNQTNPKKKHSEREALMARILIYRLDDICSGAWKPKAEEISFLEDYLKKLNMSENEVVVETLNKLQALKEEAKQPIAPEKELETTKQTTTSQPTVINFIDVSSTQTPSNNFSEKPAPVVVKAPQEKIQPSSTDVAPESQPQTSSQANVLKVSDEQAQNIPSQDNEEALSKWQQQTFEAWQKWGEKNHKIVTKYQSQTAVSDLSIKIYADTEKSKTDDFEADISYQTQRDITVKGKDGQVPSDAIFAEIVAQAKKNGPEICFGNIQSNLFKAKLMLACLNDPEVKMVNPPKLSELTDLPEDLKAKLEEKMPHSADYVKKRQATLQKEKEQKDEVSASKKADKSQSAKPVNKTKKSNQFKKNLGQEL